MFPLIGNEKFFCWQQTNENTEPAICVNASIISLMSKFCYFINHAYHMQTKNSTNSISFTKQNFTDGVKRATSSTRCEHRT